MEVNILLIEDSLSDAELIKEAFRASEIPHRIDLTTDGEKALRLLKDSDKKPHLILLDLNLPKLNGLEVLRAIRHDPDLRMSITPIIVLTNSKTKKDVLQAYTNGCNAYIRKPVGFEQLTQVVQQASTFWFNCALLPADH